MANNLAIFKKNCINYYLNSESKSKNNLARQEIYETFIETHRLATVLRHSNLIKKILDRAEQEAIDFINGMEA